ncbi:MAG: methyl-accepting chemotaxis protein [Actinomycetota bacterium]
MNVSVLAKLMGTAGAQVVLLVALGLVSISALAGIAAKVNDMTSTSVHTLRDMASADVLYNKNRTLLRDALLKTDPAEQRQIAADIAANSTAIDKAVASAVAEGSPAVHGQLVELQRNLAKYVPVREHYLAFAKQGKKEQAVAVSTAASSLIKEIGAHFDSLLAASVRESESDATAVEATYHSKRTLAIVAMLVAALVGFGLSYLVGRGIVSRVRRVLAAATDVGDGDLTVDLTDVKGGDELGRMAAGFQAMVDRLRSTVGTVQEVAKQLEASSHEMASSSEEAGRAVGEIAHAVNEVATGAERQARTAEETRVSSEEMALAAQAGSAAAQETAMAAEQALRVSQEGADAVVQATAAMTAMRTSAESLTGAIRLLGDKSEQIGGIVETITGIAGQTNLLALNAAIEAARAGEQGRGFAVVAEEVRKLAEESQRAAGSIAELVGDMQQETQRTVEAVEAGAAEIATGAVVVEQAHDAFVRIGGAVEDVTSRIGLIAASVEQIATSADTVQRGMADVASVAEQSSASAEQVSASTQETSASAEEIAASAQELASNAEELEKLVRQFRLAA